VRDKNRRSNSLWRGLTCGGGRELERRRRSLLKVGKRGIILGEELMVLGYRLGTPAVSYGDLVDPVCMYDEHGAMARDGAFSQ
jgi:hypothetical protein